MLDDAEVISTAMLANVHVAVAIPAVDVRWQFWKQGNDLPVVLPLSEDNGRDILGHVGLLSHRHAGVPINTLRVTFAGVVDQSFSAKKMNSSLL